MLGRLFIPSAREICHKHGVSIYTDKPLRILPYQTQERIEEQASFGIGIGLVSFPAALHPLHLT